MNSKIYTCGDRNDEDVKEVLFKKKKSEHVFWLFSYNLFVGKKYFFKRWFL